MADEAKRSNNPPWTREETVLAMALYKRRFPQLPGEDDPDVVDLSNKLARLAVLRGLRGNPAFRNPNGVSMKLGNLRRLDPSIEGVGLGHGAQMEEQVWSEFNLRPLELAREEMRILALIG